MKVAFLIILGIAYLLLSVCFFGYGWNQSQALSVFSICGIMGYYLAAWLVITWLLVMALGGDI